MNNLSNRFCDTLQAESRYFLHGRVKGDSASGVVLWRVEDDIVGRVDASYCITESINLFKNSQNSYTVFIGTISVLVFNLPDLNCWD